MNKYPVSIESLAEWLLCEWRKCQKVGLYQGSLLCSSHSSTGKCISPTMQFVITVPSLWITSNFSSSLVVDMLPHLWRGGGGVVVVMVAVLAVVLVYASDCRCECSCGASKAKCLRIISQPAHSGFGNYMVDQHGGASTFRIQSFPRSFLSICLLTCIVSRTQSTKLYVIQIHDGDVYLLYWSRILT